NPWGQDSEQEGPLQQVRNRLANLEENWCLQQETLKSLSALRKEIAALESEIDIDEGELAKGERFLERLRSEHQVDGEGDPLDRELAE
ncbi:MAG: hypothetical protein GWN87_28600, partial [Desulfuromonadales bacterium]|nr:hypothetical protein [Desulfuromonadales bacterium]NIS43615.1 hypothetical protein [Desulfuromonadales bacterium]